MQLIAAVEQQLLDGHWRSAWTLTGLSEPPWTAWERTSQAVHRRTFTSSPLINANWLAAAISKSKDDAYLRKQRFSPNDQHGGGGEGGNGGEGARGNGRGRGRDA